LELVRFRPVDVLQSDVLQVSMPARIRRYLPMREKLA
jgi:hypothetical protein